MFKKSLYPLFFLLSTHLIASENYCIQALTFKDKTISKSLKQKVTKAIAKFDDARVESRDKYKIFRVGNFVDKKDAIAELGRVKKYFNYSYVRRCKYDPSSFVEFVKTTPTKTTPIIPKITPKTVAIVPMTKSYTKVKDININPKIIKNKHYNPDAIDNIIKDTKKIKRDLKDHSSNSFLKGLYLKGNIAKSNKKEIEDKTKYSVELEYEIFNDGYYEAKKRENRYLLDSTREIYDTLDKLRTYSIAQKRDYLITVKNSINYYYYLNLKQNYQNLLEEKRVKVNSGKSTIWDLKVVENEIRNLELYIELYSKSARESIDKKIYKIINKIEKVSLVDRKKIVSMVQTNDYRLKMQDAYIKRASLLDDWWMDNLKVNFYAKHENSYGVKDDTIGARVEIPIGFDSQRDQIMRMKKLSHKYQKKALEIRNIQRINLLFDNFLFNKQRIKILKNELSLLMDRYMITQLKQMNQAKGIKEDKDGDMIDIYILEKKHAIVLKRFELYKILLNLQILANSNNIIVR